MADSNNRTLELPEDLAAFAQMQVDTGHYGSLVEVVREALGLLRSQSQGIDELRSALDVGIAQLETGQCARAAPKELMDGVRAELGLARNI